MLPLLLVLLIGCAEGTEAPTEASQLLPETPSLTVPEIAEIALRSTVVLEIKKKNGKWLKAASGFVVGEGLIVTAYHVIKDVTAGSTARAIGETLAHPIEQVVAVDKPHDLAILQANVIAPPLLLGDSDTLRIGEPVYVTGNPDGLFVNLEMLRQGYGIVWTNPTFEFLELFTQYESISKVAEKGIWKPEPKEIKVKTLWD